MDPSPVNSTGTAAGIVASLISVFLFVVAGVASFAVGGWAVDDSWIVLRYVRNILEGHGWVYNIGEYVNGSTSTLNTLVLVVLGWCTGDLALAQYLTLTLAIGGTATIWFFEFGRFGRGPATIAALIILASPMQYATLGLESTLVLLCGSAAVAAYARNRLVLAGAAYGLLFLARGDGILLGIPLGLALLWSARRSTGSLRTALVPGVQLFGTALLVVTPWLVFSTFYFGSPVPQTFAAKLAQTAGGAWGEDTFFAWIPYYFAFLDWRDLGVGPWPFGIVLAVGSFLSWRYRAWFPTVPIILAWCALQCLAYSVLRLPRYHWYFTQMLFATTLGLVVIGLSLWSQRPRRTGEPLKTRHLASLACCCTWLWITTVDYARLPNVHYPVYQKAARWLNEHAPEDASVAAMDIGILGYMVGDRPIVDMCSLVHADGVADIAQGNTGWWHRREPEYIVVHQPVRGTFEQPVLDRPDFAEHYEVAADPCSGIRIYRRRADAEASAPR